MDAIEKDFLEIFEKSAAHGGLDSRLVRLLGLVILSPKELSVNDLARKTGFSLASVSSKVTLLEKIGMIRKVRKPNSHKVFVEMDKNTIKLNRDMTVSRLESIETMTGKLPTIITKYKAKKLNSESKQKLDNLKEFNNNMVLISSTLSDVVSKFDKMLKDMSN